MRKYSKGFTFIELLVVLSIIGILFTIVLANIKLARDKAMSAKALQELSALQKAIELYKTDNVTYPLESTQAEYYDQGGDTSLKDALTPLLKPKYIQSIPTAPKFPNNDEFFVYSTVPSNAWGSGYTLYCGDKKDYRYVIWFHSYTKISLSRYYWVEDSNPTVKNDYYTYNPINSSEPIERTYCIAN